ncbi:hypothetical protein [Butyrivibrio sp. VCD2006]|jgi:hypothetical protein|uniref:hypothetical protein n=1 Tax=Butyrivibrio sp. VCD2006 TaxID=1280664 RepID=UPI00056D51BB|nr:hypothetical protein [Butyrivibrio sp. VCD2006]
MNSEMQTTTSGERGTGMKRVLIAVVALVMVALVVTIAVLANKLIKKDEPKEQKNVITAENVDEVMDDWLNETPKPNAPVYYTVVQNTDWTFPDGSSPSTDATVANDKENETAVYFDVIVDETGETIYSSPVLELGAEITNFKLDKALEKGDYICTVVYHLVDENQDELSSVNIGTTIHVLN